MRKILLLLLVAAPFIVKAQTETPPPPPPVDNSNSRDTIGIFQKVEIEASFPGGDAAWRKYLEQNFQATKVSDAIYNSLSKKEKQKKSFVYTAIVQFIVCKDGSVCEVKTLNNVPEPLAKEAERLINQAGSWSPAEQGGRKVKAYRKQPITFEMSLE